MDTIVASVVTNGQHKKETMKETLVNFGLAIMIATIMLCGWLIGGEIAKNPVPRKEMIIVFIVATGASFVTRRIKL